MLLDYNKHNITMRTTKLSQNSCQNNNDEFFSSCMEDIANNQDKIAFSSIFKHFAPRLKSYFVKAGATENQAEEVIQEVMLAVWTKAASYDKNKSSVTTWIYTIARNKRIDKIRKEKRHYLLESDDGLEIPVPSTQEGEIMSWQISNKIKAFLDILPKEQSKLLKLSYFHEKTHSDIAKELKLPLGTVKSRIRLALSKMRNLSEAN